MARRAQTPERLAERLVEIDLRRPSIDKRRAERAVAAHLAALGIGSLPVRWIDDPTRMGERWRSPGCAAWVYRFSRKSHPVETGHLPVFLAARKRARRRQPFDALAAARVDAGLLRLGTPPEHHETNPYRISHSALVSAYALAAPELAAHPGDPAARARLAAVAPFVTLLEAGVFEMNVRARFVQLLTRPNVEWVRGQLHRWDGYPAVWWPDGPTKLYIWRGVHMPDAAGARPFEVTPRRIAGWTNAERRRVAIERLGGMDVFLRDGGAELVSQDDFGRLWRSRFQVNGERYAAVEVVNTTAEPDGSQRRYFLRVPPTTRTAREAVAWTFGFERADDYILAAAS